MTQDLATREANAALMEKVVIQGDLKELTPKERVTYYFKVCESLGLNPYTRPFQYIVLNNKLTLYAAKDCTEQLRRRDAISVSLPSKETIGDVYVVTAKATTKEGRTDESTGVVTIKGLGGEFLANAFMKAETKAKRRVTLSISGLGWLDESEVDTIKDATIVEVDTETGEIRQPPAKPAAPAPKPPVAQGTALTPEKAMSQRAVALAGAHGLTADELKAWCNDKANGAFPLGGMSWANAGLAEKVAALNVFEAAHEEQEVQS
ncbi:MAG: hypothetical protein Q8P22_14340 [Chloroflexota bacterium]|nr:hypothetical protein [Chloroflexota bacterium]